MDKRNNVFPLTITAKVWGGVCMYRPRYPWSASDKRTRVAETQRFFAVMISRILSSATKQYGVSLLLMCYHVSYCQAKVSSNSLASKGPQWIPQAPEVLLPFVFIDTRQSKFSPLNTAFFLIYSMPLWLSFDAILIVTIQTTFPKGFEGSCFFIWLTSSPLQKLKTYTPDISV